VWIGLIANSQSIDSLKKALESTENTNKQVELLFKLSEEYKAIDLHQAYKSIDEALELAKNLDFANNLAQAYYIKGELYLFEEMDEKALVLFANANDQYENLADSEGMCKCQKKIAALLEKRGSLNQALDSYLKVLGFYEMKGDAENQIEINISIGNMFRSLGEDQSAVGYYSSALDLVEKTDNSETFGFIANHLGMIYSGKGEHNQALDYFFLALRKYKSSNDKDGRASVLTNIGILNYYKSDVGNALNYFNNSLELNQEAVDMVKQALNYLWIGKCHFRNGDFDLAEDAFQASMKISQERNLSNNIRVVTHYLAMIYADKMDFETAFRMEFLHNEMQDSLSNIGKIKDRARIELKYQYEQEQKEKDLLAKEESDRQLFFVHILIGLLVTLGLLSFLISWIYLIKRRANKELSEKNEIIHKAFQSTIKIKTVFF